MPALSEAAAHGVPTEAMRRMIGGQRLACVAFALAIAIAWSVQGAPTHAQETPASATATGLAQRLRNARTVEVFRLDATPDSAPSATRGVRRIADLPVRARARASSEWVAQLATALEQGVVFFDATGRPPCRSCPERHTYAVRFRDLSHGIDVLFHLDQKWVEVRTNGTSTAEASVAVGDSSLVPLFAAAFPAPAVPPRAAAPPRPVFARAESTRTVEVESLPVVIHRAAPMYPPDAQARGVSGEVVVEALVDRKGKVQDVKVIHSIEGLDDAAIQAVYHWRFKPALADGRPKAVWISIPVRFTLQ